MNLQEWLDRQVDGALRRRRALLERMAAAYLLMTDIPPTEVTLVEEQVGPKLTWRFERRAAPEVLR